MAYDIYCDFDPMKHKSTYTDYLEVVIDERGKVYYAIPSHQEKLLTMASERTGLTRQQVGDLCPKVFYCDFIMYLSILAGAVPVWDAWVEGDYMTKKQVQALRKLKLMGLYRGNIPLTLPSKFPDWKDFLKQYGVEIPFIENT